MTEIPQSALAATLYLLPGFIAAWIYYALTSHPKPPQFERVIQALIFTFIISTIAVPIQFLLIWIGNNWAAILPWNEATERTTSLVIAILLGGIAAFISNTDSLHKSFRKFKLTTRTSHPSEWYYILSKKVTFIILHLQDGRRLYGWPKEWPITSDEGQFYIMVPAWINEDGDQIDLPELDGILIRARDVQWIEFINQGNSDE